MSDISTNIQNLATDLRDFRTKLTNAGITVSSTAGFRECVDALEFNGASDPEISLPYYVTLVDQIDFGATTADRVRLEYKPLITGGRGGSSYYEQFVWGDSHSRYRFTLNTSIYKPGFYDICANDGPDAATITIHMESNISSKDELQDPYNNGGWIPRVYVDEHGYLKIAADIDTCKNSMNIADFTIDLIPEIEISVSNADAYGWIVENVYFYALRLPDPPAKLTNLYRYYPASDEYVLTKENELEKMPIDYIGYMQDTDSYYYYSISDDLGQYYGNELPEVRKLHLLNFDETYYGKKKYKLSLANKNV